MAGLVSEELPKLEDPRKLQGISYTPEKIQFDPTTDTVEGRIDRLIQKNSGLMQSVSTRSNEDAQRRGLLNSSIALGEGQKALYAAAMPIAQTDAGLSLNTKFADAGAINTARSLGATGAQQIQNIGAQGDQSIRAIGASGAENLRSIEATGNQNVRSIAAQGDQAFRSITQQGEINSRLQAERGQIEVQLQSADASMRQSLLTRQGEIDRELQTLRGQQALDIAALTGSQQLQIATLDNKYRMMLQTSSNAAQLYANSTGAIGAIMAEPALKAASKQSLIDQQLKLLNNGLALIGSMGNVKLDEILDINP